MNPLHKPGTVAAGWKIANSVKKYDFVKEKVNEARKENDFVKEREIISKYMTVWIKDLLKSLKITVEVEGKENIPDEPCVFIANHQGYADVFALTYAIAPKTAGFIAKKELEKVPVFGGWIEFVRGILIPTGNPREALKVINKGCQYIDDGFNMVIFPEGKRSWGQGMRTFKPGSFKLATKSKVPVVPIAIEGSYHVFEEKEKFMKNQKIKVSIMKPVETADMDRGQIKQLPEDIEKSIREELSKLIGKEVPHIEDNN